MYRNKLLADQTISEEQAQQIDQDAKDEAEASAEFAQSSPFPDVSELMDDVYWETDNPEHKNSLGSIFLNPQIILIDHASDNLQRSP